MQFDKRLEADRTPSGRLTDGACHQGRLLSGTCVTLVYWRALVRIVSARQYHAMYASTRVR
jgi:hypothetical protein